jgi:hypothetical protein
MIGQYLTIMYSHVHTYNTFFDFFFFFFLCYFFKIGKTKTMAKSFTLW